MTTRVPIRYGGTGANTAASARTALGVPPLAAYDTANSAYDQANAAYAQANSAYDAANNAQVTVYANNSSNVTTQNVNFVNTATVTVTVTADGANANIEFTAAPQTVVNDTYTAAGNTAAAATANIANGLYAISTSAYSQANSAYDQANAAYSQANTVYAQANAAYDAANTANSNALNSYAQANSAYGQANDAYAQANTAYGQANSAYDAANTANSNALAAYAQANSAYDAANTANNNALTAYGQANNAYDAANTANTNALNAYGKANNAYDQANSAYNEANLKLNITGGTINGSLNVSGNLTITGNTKYVNVDTYLVSDPLIYLAANNNLTDLVDIGFLGAHNTAGIYQHSGLARDAGDGTWYLFTGLPSGGHDNNIVDFANTTLATLRANINANSILLLGNPVATESNLVIVYNQANSAYDQANAAKDQANTARNTANDSYDQANTARNTANDSYDQANTARDQANAAYSQANAAYDQANASYGQANTARDTANAAYDAANAAYNQANTAYDAANTANSNALDAYSQANSAYTAANNAANTVRVSQNSSATLSAKQLNFVNTANIIIAVADSGDGNANISFDLTTPTGGGTLSNIAISSNGVFATNANAFNFINTASISVTVDQGNNGNANISFIAVGAGLSNTVVKTTTYTSVNADANLSYTLPITPVGEPYLFVIKNGITLTPNTDYSVNGSILTVIESGAANDVIEVRYFDQVNVFENPNTQIIVDSNTVVAQTNTFTISQNVTSISKLLVSKNGLQLTPNKHFIVTGNVVTLNTVAEINDVVTFTHFKDIGELNDIVIATAAYDQANDAYDAANTKLPLSGGTLTGTLTTRDIIPSANITYNIGSSTARFNDIWLSNSTIYLGDAELRANGDKLVVSGVELTSGANVVADVESAYNQANTARNTANNAYNQANTARDQANAAYNQANSARSDANTTFGVINSSFGSVNTAITNAHNQANSAYDTANLKLNITGGTINGSLNVSGNLTITGNTKYTNVDTYLVSDPLIYLAANNDTSDLVDIGFMGGHNTNGVYQHSGLARDAGDGTWYLFTGLAEEGHENNVVDFANTSLATLRANINANSILLTGNAVATQANLTLAHDAANNRVLKSGDTLTGNLTFSGDGLRILGDFSNATPSNRLLLQSNTTNGLTSVGIIPNGTSTTSALVVNNASDASNASFLQLLALAAETRINSSYVGTGTFLPMTFFTGGSERMRLDTSGNLGIGTSSPDDILDIQTPSNNYTMRLRASASNFALVRFVNNSNSNTDAIIGTNGANTLVFYTNGFNERMRIDSSGNVGIGGTADAFAKFLVTGTLPTSSNITVANYSRGTVPSGATSVAYGYYSRLGTQAASFTLGGLIHNYVNPATFGAGSTVNNQYGYYAESTLTGATNNYGFYSNIASGSNRWNFYAAGTADNYFAGNVGIGAVPSGSERLRVLCNTATTTYAQVWDVYNGASFQFSNILGGDSTNGVYFGPFQGVPLRFITNNTERVRIDSSGNVQIGNPNALQSERLHVKAGAVLGDAAGSTLYNSVFYTPDTTNITRLSIYDYRVSNGSSHTSSRNIIQRRVDATDMGFVGFDSNFTSIGWGTTVALAVTSGGNVGIGTASPTTKLQSAGTSGSAQFRAGTASNGYFEVNAFDSNPVYCVVGGSNATAGVFGTQSNIPTIFFSNNTERMRITSDGEVYIAGTTDQGAYNLQVNGTGVWGAGAYVNGSDARIKKNIQPLDSTLDIVMAINPVKYQYVEEYSNDRSVQPGFTAQDLQIAMAGKDYLNGVVQQGKQYLNVAYQNMIPILLKAIQELKTELNEAKAEIAALKNA